MRRVFQFLEYASLRLGQIGHHAEPVYRDFNVSDLLVAHRLATRLSNGQRVLDVGCGDGRKLRNLSLYRDVDATGVDLVVPARREGSLPDRIALLPYDGRRLPFRDLEFDVTLIGYVLHHLSCEHARALFREALRVTRKRILLVEDSLPTFGTWYHLRNTFHRLDTNIEYGARPGFASRSGNGGFRTHAEWRDFVATEAPAATVSVESLAGLAKYRHHTLMDVALRRDAGSVTGTGRAPR